MLKQITDISKDKWLHFVFSLVGSMMLSALLGFTGLKGLAVVIGCGVVFLAGVCKELWDRKHGGTPEIGDMVADFFGVFVSMCMSCLTVAGFGGVF